MDAVSMLQVGSSFVWSATFAWLMGACCARRWLRDAADSKDGDGGAVQALRGADKLASGLGVLAGALSLLAATAVMGGTTLRAAWPMFWPMAAGTDFGHAGSVAIVAMVGVLATRVLGRDGARADIVVALCLTVFALARASMGHAGEGGYWTLAYAAEVVHLTAIAVWAGVVFVSASLPLRESRLGALGAPATARYLALMSRAAMLAVTAIIVTGAYNAWQRVGTGAQLLHTAYGITLLVKLGLVGVALALGGYNKVVGLPAAARSRDGIRRVRAVLGIESAVLIGVLLAAAALTSQAPPSAM